MRALSMIQPWAWLMVRPDLVDPVKRGIAKRKLLQIKGVENRVWNTHFRGRFLLHASKRMSRDDYASASEFAASVSKSIELPPFGEIECGGLVGVATLVEVLPPLARPTEPWHMPNQYGFILADVDPVPFRPCKGARGWWDYPATPDELRSFASPLERRVLEMAGDEIGRVSMSRLLSVLGEEHSRERLVIALHDLLVVGLLQECDGPGSLRDQAGWYGLAEPASTQEGSAGDGVV